MNYSQAHLCTHPRSFEKSVWSTGALLIFVTNWFFLPSLNRWRIISVLVKLWLFSNSAMYLLSDKECISRCPCFVSVSAKANDVSSTNYCVQCHRRKRIISHAGVGLMLNHAQFTCSSIILPSTFCVYLANIHICSYKMFEVFLCVPSQYPYLFIQNV